MSHVSRNLSLATCLAGALTAAGVGQPAAAADWQRTYLEPAVQAWMGVVTLLAEDGERAEKSKPRAEKCAGDCKEGCEQCDRKGHGERHHHGHHGMHPPGSPVHGRMGPRGDALGMLNDIVGRLSRIEAMLAGRGPMMGRGPGEPSADGRGPWRGPGRSEMSPEMRAWMEARMKEGREKMREAREQWEQASPEEREAMRKQMEGRRQEAREKMEQARAERGERPRDADGMNKAMERVREEGRKRMEEAKAKMEEARKRFQEMEQRVKRLEAEVARLRKAAEKDD